MNIWNGVQTLFLSLVESPMALGIVLYHSEYIQEYEFNFTNKHVSTKCITSVFKFSKKVIVIAFRSAMHTGTIGSGE